MWITLRDVRAGAGADFCIPAGTCCTFCSSREQCAYQHYWEEHCNDFPLVMKYVNYRLFYISKVLAQYKQLFLPSFEQTLWERKKRESEAYCLEHNEVKLKITALSTMKKKSQQSTQPNQPIKQKIPQNHPNKKTTKSNSHNNHQKKFPQSNSSKLETKFCNKYASTFRLVFWIENGYLLNWVSQCIFRWIK